MSAFSGPEPTIHAFPTAEDEARAVASWLTDRINDGVKPEEIGIFVRSEAELSRVRTAVSAAALNAVQLNASTDVTSGSVSVCTMHFAKGLEFRVVVVAACDDEIVPLQARIEAVTDDADLEEVYNTERHLLYVACTRAPR